MANPGGPGHHENNGNTATQHEDGAFEAMRASIDPLGPARGAQMCWQGLSLGPVAKLKLDCPATLVRNLIINGHRFPSPLTLASRPYYDPGQQ